MKLEVDAIVELDDLSEKLKSVPKNKSVRIAVHNTLAKYCEPYIPAEKGVLNQKFKVTQDYVQWYQPYAHYQWVGKVYTPNVPVYRFGKIEEWRSPVPKGSKKKTDRNLGEPGQLENWTFGYHNPKSAPHWEEAMMRENGKAFCEEVGKIIERGIHNG